VQHTVVASAQMAVVGETAQAGMDVLVQELPHAKRGVAGAVDLLYSLLLAWHATGLYMLAC
jgi:ElaB/YqjD/DUF883 family membrane-anchored ribosome-binding protein